MIGSYRDLTHEADKTARSMKFYSDVQLDDLMKEFRIPAELSEQVARHLQTAAERWYAWRARDPVEVAATRAALKSISDDLNSTRKRLQSLPEEVWRSLGEAPHWFDVGPNEYRVDGEYLDEPSFKHVRLSVEVGSDFESHFASISEIVVMLDALAERAHVVEQVEGHFHGKRGPKPDLAFYEWARLIVSIWYSTLGREFTYDAKSGGAVSEAARFCVAAFMPLHPQHSERETVKKLRSFLDFQRKSKNFRN